jgi:hypothetical protein
VPTEKDWKSFTNRAFVGTFKCDLISMFLLNLAAELTCLFYSWWIGFIIKFLLDENATTKEGLTVIGVFVVAILIG